MNVEDRRKAVQELTAEGESTRAIAETLGTSHTTIENDLAGKKLPENIESAGVSGKKLPKTIEPAVDSGPNVTPIDAIAALAATFG